MGSIRNKMSWGLATALAQFVDAAPNMAVTVVNKLRRPVMVLRLATFVAMAAAIVSANPVASAPGDTVADRVFGQSDFSSGHGFGPCAPPPTASSLCAPQGVATDSSGNLYVVDLFSSRVLE